MSRSSKVTFDESDRTFGNIAPKLVELRAMTTYRTFLRSARNWQEFSGARKTTQERGLTLEKARQRCE
jgi:hypothetical protein